MATVLIDTKTFKITLGIVEDFINFDFLNFLKKGYDPESEKIITWEMLIYCKVLDDKNKSYVNYYLFQLKKVIEETLNENLYLQGDKYEEQIENFYVKTHTTNKYSIQCYFIAPEVQICKNPALIKIYFYCNETNSFYFSGMYVKNEILKQYKDLKDISYISQLKNLFVLIISTIEENTEYFANFCGGENLYEIIMSSKYHKFGISELSVYGIIHSILIDHYTKTLETLYDTAYKEITKTTREAPLIRGDIKMITQKYSAIKDFQEIHINKICKVDVIKQIKKIIKTKFKDTKDLSDLTYTIL